MNCRDALLLLEFARPGATELEGADIAALETHLADCRPCSTFARHEREWTDRIVTAINPIPDPSRGKADVLNRIHQKRRGWQKQIALICAIVVIAGSTLWGLIPGPNLYPEIILTDCLIQFGNLDQCKDWLNAQNSLFQFPPGFQAQYLISFERRAIHGTRAPVLTFVRGDSRAQVTVLTSNQFRNLPKLEHGRAGENSVGTILIIRDINVPGVVYLVEIVNGPVERFYNEPVNTVT
jgi:hypothetical protein